MQKQTVLARSNDFFRSVMIIDIWIFALVGLLCYHVGSRTVSEYGQTLLIAALGAAVIGVLELSKSAEMSWVREYQSPVLARRAGLRMRVREEVLDSRESYRFFWLMIAVAAVAFVVGGVMQFIAADSAFFG